MSIQDQIDEQINKTASNDPMTQATGAEMPIGSIVITGDSGSFTVPKGVRLLLRDCSSCTLLSNEGENEVQFYNCSDVNVMSYTQGILRFEQCSSIQQVTCQDEVQLVCGDGSFTGQMMLTSCQATLLNCTFQAQLTFTDSEINSCQNKYQGNLNLSSGRFHSDNDTFLQFTTDGDGVYTLVAPQFQGMVTFDADVVSISKGQFTGQATFTDTKLIDNQGQYQQATFSGSDSICDFRQSTFQQLSLSDGAFNLFQVETTGTFTGMTASICSRELQAGASVSITDGTYVGLKDEFSATFSLSSCAANFNEATFKAQFTGQNGALESTSCEYKQFTYTGGTILSINDTFQGELSLTDMVSFNKLFKPETSGTCTLQGKDFSASLEVVDIDSSSSITVKNWGSASFLTGSMDGSVTMNDIRFLKAISVDIQGTLTADSISTSIWPNSTTMNGTFQNCGTFILDDAEFQQPNFQNCGQILGAAATITGATFQDVTMVTTQSATIMGIQNGFLVDSGSTILGAQGSTIQGNNSTVTGATGCLVSNVGGTTSVSGGSVVISVGGSVINPDGFSSGTSFAPELSAGAVQVSGTDLTIMSIGKMTVRSQTEKISMEALQDVSISSDIAGVSISAAQTISTQSLGLSVQSTTGSIDVEQLELLGTSLGVTEDTMDVEAADVSIDAG